MSALALSEICQRFIDLIPLPPDPQKPKESIICQKLFKQALSYGEHYLRYSYNASDADFADTEMGELNEIKLKDTHQKIKALFNQMQEKQCSIPALKDHFQHTFSSDTTSQYWQGLTEFEKNRQKLDDL